MNKCYKLLLPVKPGKVPLGRIVQHTVISLGAHKHPEYDGAPYPSHQLRRAAPGQVRRREVKEASRRVDRQKVKEIIAMILAKDEVKSPPESIEDIKFKIGKRK